MCDRRQHIPNPASGCENLFTPHVQQRPSARGIPTVCYPLHVHGSWKMLPNALKLFTAADTVCRRHMSHPWSCNSTLAQAAHHAQRPPTKYAHDSENAAHDHGCKSHAELTSYATLLWCGRRPQEEVFVDETAEKVEYLIRPGVQPTPVRLLFSLCEEVLWVLSSSHSRDIRPSSL